MLLDVIAVAPGPGVHRRISVRAGGTAANAALAARTLGADASVVSRIGTDDVGALIRTSLESQGVRLALALDPERPSGCYIQIGSVVAVDRGASAALRPSDVGDLEADAILFSVYVIFNDDTAGAGQKALAATAKWRGADVGAAFLVASTARGRVVERLAGANVIFADEQEAAALTGLSAEPAALALARCHEVAVVKMGARGAVAATGSRIVRAEAPMTTEVASTTGAGDALDAGVLVGLASGLSLAAALELGTRSARWALER